LIVDAKLKAAQRKLTERVMGKAGVSGTAIGERGGEPCLLVYVSESKAKKAVPRSIDGVRVVVEVTGGFKAL
jgi:hypothetical protein